MEKTTTERPRFLGRRWRAIAITAAWSGVIVAGVFVHPLIALGLGFAARGPIIGAWRTP